jgi:hypothetical protein
MPLRTAFTPVPVASVLRKLRSGAAAFGDENGVTIAPKIWACPINRLVGLPVKMTPASCVAAAGLRAGSS